MIYSKKTIINNKPQYIKITQKQAVADYIEYMDKEIRKNKAPYRFFDWLEMI